MNITKKDALLVLVFAVVCAIALAGCGSAGTSSSASSTASASASAAVSASANASTDASNSAAATQQADEQAMAYVGTWKTDKLTLEAKTNASDEETDLDVPVALELNDDMTGTLTVGESTQNFEWEVRYWENLKIERAVITLHETFQLKNLKCDPGNMMLELADSENSARLFYNWTSSEQSGVKLGIDMMVERVS